MARFAAFSNIWLARLSAAVLVGGLLLCASKPLQLFYQPPGAAFETYRERPVPLRLLTYPASRDANLDGAVLFIHGGGWTVEGAGLPLYQNWEELVLDHNVRAFAVEHRTPPRYRGRDQVEDVLTALEYINDRHERFGFPRDRIALVGFSSGGHLAVLASLLATRPRPGLLRQSSPPVQAAVAFYAPLDPERLLAPDARASAEMTRILRNYLPSYDAVARGEISMGWLSEREIQMRSAFEARVLRDVSPLRNLHAEAPPMLLIHGTADRLVPFSQSVAFAERANELRPGMATLLPVDGADHNFDVSRSRWARQIEAQAMEFAVERLRGE